MKIVKWFMFVVMVLLPVLVSAQDKMKDYPVTDSSISLDSQAFKGFEKCRISHQLSGVKARFIKSGKPEKRKASLDLCCKSRGPGLAREGAYGWSL